MLSEVSLKRIVPQSGSQKWLSTTLLGDWLFLFHWLNMQQCTMVTQIIAPILFENSYTTKSRFHPPIPRPGTMAQNSFFYFFRLPTIQIDYWIGWMKEKDSSKPQDHWSTWCCFFFTSILISYLFSLQEHLVGQVNRVDISNLKYRSTREFSRNPLRMAVFWNT